MRYYTSLNAKQKSAADCFDRRASRQYIILMRWQMEGLNHRPPRITKLYCHVHTYTYTHFHHAQLMGIGERDDHRWARQSALARSTQCVCVGVWWLSSACVCVCLCAKRRRRHRLYYQRKRTNQSTQTQREDRRNMQQCVIITARPDRLFHINLNCGKRRRRAGFAAAEHQAKRESLCFSFNRS